MHNGLTKSFHSDKKSHSKLLCLTDVLAIVRKQIQDTSLVQLREKFNVGSQEADYQSESITYMLSDAHKGNQIVSSIENHFEGEAARFEKAFASYEDTAARFMIPAKEYYSEDYVPKTEHESLSSIERSIMQQTVPALIKCYVWQNDLTKILESIPEILPEWAVHFASDDPDNDMTIKALERAQISETIGLVSRAIDNAQDHAAELRSGYLLCINRQSLDICDHGGFDRQEKARPFKLPPPVNQTEQELIKRLDNTPGRFTIVIR